MNNQCPNRIASKELNKWIQEGSVKPLLIDVREEDELQIASFSFPVEHLPLSQIERWSETFKDKFSTERPIVVICHAGVRSWNFGNWLIDQGWGYEVWNLDGGIDDWSINVDSKVKRY